MSDTLLDHPEHPGRLTDQGWDSSLETKQVQVWDLTIIRRGDGHKPRDLTEERDTWTRDTKSQAMELARDELQRSLSDALDDEVDPDKDPFFYSPDEEEEGGDTSSEDDGDAAVEQPPKVITLRDVISWARDEWDLNRVVELYPPEFNCEPLLEFDLSERTVCITRKRKRV
jgi:hypothetical protein